LIKSVLTYFGKITKDYRIVTKKVLKVFNKLSLLSGSAKLALLGFAFESARVFGQTPNVPKCVGIKLFFKMCGGKNFKNIGSGLSVGFTF
jgi:hypothetical protein